MAHYLDASPLTRDVQDRAAFSEKIIEGAQFLYKNPLADGTKVHHLIPICCSRLIRHSASLSEPVYVDSFGHAS